MGPGRRLLPRDRRPDRRAGARSRVTLHYVFSDGIELASTASLRFRSEEEVRGSLDAAGFVVDHIYGGWHHDPIGHPDGELLVVAHRGECIQQA